MLAIHISMSCLTTNYNYHNILFMLNNSNENCEMFLEKQFI